jgi:hypothetical protein
MAKGPGRCIFCGRSGLSKEHVFPDWMREIFPRSSTDTHTHGSMDYGHLPIVGQNPLVSQRTRQGQAGTRKVRVVCRTCNGGWLSRMEKSTQPVLKDLLQGHSFSFTDEQREALARWITRTVMTAEFLDQHGATITQAERSAFFTSPNALPHWNIWIAPYLGLNWQAGGIFHHAVGFYPPPHPIRPGIRNMQYTVLAIGHFVAVAVSCAIPGIIFGLENEGRSDLIPISPTHRPNLAWPTAGWLTDRSLDAVLGNFARWMGVPLPAVGSLDRQPVALIPQPLAAG